MDVLVLDLTVSHRFPPKVKAKIKMRKKKKHNKYFGSICFSKLKYYTSYLVFLADKQQLYYPLRIYVMRCIKSLHL